MKLVEILARELEDWQEDAKAIAQDADACAHPYAATEIEYADGEWSSGVISSKYNVNMPDLATDHTTAIVTREQWQDERAKLEGQKQWNGDGLPPIGTKGCTSGGDAEVLGVDEIKRQIFVRWHDGETGVVPDFCFKLRPIPTDREKWVEAAMNYWDHEMPRVSLEHIYDAGLAKLPD